jgi:hypothetical protein
MELAFFSCSTPDKFPLLSTVGVRPASQVRLPDAQLCAFLKRLPVLSEDVVEGAKPMVNSLKNRNVIKPILFDDVLDELRSRPLEEGEMVACLKWWVGLHKQTGADNSRLHAVRAKLLEAALVSVGVVGSGNERIIPLSVIKTFINFRGLGANIPLEGPLPPHVLPTQISKHFQPDELTSSFPWTDLSILDWLTHIADPSTISQSGVEFDLNTSAQWAETVLNVLVRAWPSISNPMKEDIRNVLKDKTCIPTSSGLRKPDESYFANANVFKDLPVILMPSGQPVKAPLERVLLGLGVRKHVDLQVVFNR